MPLISEAAAEHGSQHTDEVTALGFYEKPEAIFRKSDRIGLGIRQAAEHGLLDVVWQQPAEGIIDILGERLLRGMREHDGGAPDVAFRLPTRRRHPAVATTAPVAPVAAGRPAPRSAAEVREDARDQGRLVNQRQEPHPAAAPGTRQDVVPDPPARSAPARPAEALAEAELRAISCAQRRFDRWRAARAGASTCGDNVPAPLLVEGAGVAAGPPRAPSLPSGDRHAACAASTPS